MASAESIFQLLDTSGTGTVQVQVIKEVLQSLDPVTFQDFNVFDKILMGFDNGSGGIQVGDFLDAFGFEQSVPAVNASLLTKSGASHVAVVGSGFVGTAAAFAMVCRETAARITLTDVNTAKCEGEVLDLADGAIGNRVFVASPKEAGQADVIVITAGRGQREGETRLDLIKANSAIMRGVIAGMQPIKRSAKIIVVSNPCDALTYVAQECSGLPQSQVFGSGTVLDSKRLCVALSKIAGVSPESVSLFVLGEHGDSQFPVASLASIGGVPLLECKKMEHVDLAAEAKASAKKAYSIISKKRYTAFGIGRAIESIVDCILKDKRMTLPVSVPVPKKNCCLSLPCVVGFNGVERVLEGVIDHFSDAERLMYENGIRVMQEMVGTAPEEGQQSKAESKDEKPADKPVKSKEHESLGSYGDAHQFGTHVAIVGAGFVGTFSAYALLCCGVASRITLTDVNTEKCLGEVLDLEDGNGRVEMATPQQAGQADVIVITAGRGQREGETRLDLVKANCAIMKGVIAGMQPIKLTAKIIVVSNPCDALTYVAQECSGLPQSQVFGSGTVLDSRRLSIALAQRIGVNHESINLFVLGEHGDSQFPASSLANIGGVPLLECNNIKDIDLNEEAKRSAGKAYDIIGKKGYTAFGVARAIQTIVEAVLNDKQHVLSVSVRLADGKCCLSLPCVVGIHGVERVLQHVVDHFTPEEMAKYDASRERMIEALAACML